MTTDTLGRAPRQTLRALSWMLVATVAFSSMHALVRHITQELHFFEVAFFRNFFGLVALLPMFLRYGLAPLRTKRIGLLTLRGGAADRQDEQDRGDAERPAEGNRGSKHGA